MRDDLERRKAAGEKNLVIRNGWIREKTFVERGILDKLKDQAPKK